MFPAGSLNHAMALVVALVSLVTFTGGRIAWKRPLAIGSKKELAASYRTTFFLAFALTESGMMLSFVACFIVDEWWPFLIGLGFFLIGMTLIAPSRRNLERRDRELMSRGSRYLLSDALSTTNLDD